MKIESNKMMCKSKTCENCEFIMYKNDNEEIPSCLLDGKKVGLLHTCNNFKFTTGKHYTKL